jgi:hypothetical protein
VELFTKPRSVGRRVWVRRASGQPLWNDNPLSAPRAIVGSDEIRLGEVVLCYYVAPPKKTTSMSQA